MTGASVGHRDAHAGRPGAGDRKRKEEGVEPSVGESE
jgi:hypothetical protein